MADQHEAFSPQNVDETLARLAHTDRLQGFQHGQEHTHQDQRLVRGLQQLYNLERQDYQQALQRVEDRLLEQRLTRTGKVPIYLPDKRRQLASDTLSMVLKDIKRMEKTRTAKFKRRFSILAAAVVMAILVGSLALALGHLRQQTNTASQRGTGLTNDGTPSSTAAPVTPGQTLYTTPSNQWGFNGLSWSPDGKRIASSTVDGVQIWDATTGKHLITLNESAYGLAWSPNSQNVAVATGTGLIIVNGETGTTVHTYSASVTSIEVAGGRSALATRISAGGGLGFRSAAWSPDGRFVAGAVSSGASGSIEVFDTQTSALAYTLNVTGNYVPAFLTWSSDGKYLAASVFNSEPGDQTVASALLQMIWAWNVSNRQIIFMQSGGNGVGNPLAFQPASDNLAFVTIKGKEATLVLWNITASSPMKTYVLAGSGTLAWSPDGRELAYVGSAYRPVNILDINTGKVVYTYQGNKQNIAQLAWSPDGKYLVSGEGQTSGLCVAKVWTA